MSDIFFSYSSVILLLAITELYSQQIVINFNLLNWSKRKKSILRLRSRCTERTGEAGFYCSFLSWRGSVITTSQLNQFPHHTSFYPDTQLCVVVFTPWGKPCWVTIGSKLKSRESPSIRVSWRTVSMSNSNFSMDMSSRSLGSFSGCEGCARTWRPYPLVLRGQKLPGMPPPLRWPDRP